MELSRQLGFPRLVGDASGTGLRQLNVMCIRWNVSWQFLQIFSEKLRYRTCLEQAIAVAFADCSRFRRRRKKQSGITNGMRAKNTSESRNQLSGRIRILIVDDHPLVRESLKRIIQQQPDLSVCGETDNGSRGLEVGG